jgi:hypothetical protein
VLLEGLGQLKISSYLIGNRASDLSACIVVSAMLPRSPHVKHVGINIEILHVNPVPSLFFPEMLTSNWLLNVKTFSEDRWYPTAGRLLGSVYVCYSLKNGMVLGELPRHKSNRSSSRVKGSGHEQRTEI